METFLIYKHFKKSLADTSPRQALADFWLGFLLVSSQPFTPTDSCPVRSPRVRCAGLLHGVTCARDPCWGETNEASLPLPRSLQVQSSSCPVCLLQVLILEPAQVLQPAQLTVREDQAECSLMLHHVCPMEEVRALPCPAWLPGLPSLCPTRFLFPCRQGFPAGPSRLPPSAGSGEAFPPSFASRRGLGLSRVRLNPLCPG